MEIGDNIKEIREFEKNYKRSYVAEKLGITTRAYSNIENNIADVTLRRLEEIAKILECSALDILTYRQKKKEFYNTIHNGAGNQGTIKIDQSGQESTFKLIYNLQQELIESERRRISLLESLLKENNIDF